jgi:hypothetical protein
VGANDLTDAIVLSVVDTLERGRVEIDNAMRAKGYEAPLGPIFSDEIKTQVIFPAIQVVAADKEVEWAAQRVRRETYNLYVDCLIKNIKKEEAGAFVRSLGSAVQNWLNDFYNLRFYVGGTEVMVYDSRATRVEYGFRRGGALRAARISWFGKTTNPVSVPL